MPTETAQKKELGRFPIKDVCTSIIDCVNKTAPKADFLTPYKMLRTTNVKSGWIILENLNSVTEEVFKKWTRRQVPQRGDVILTREAPLGEVGLLRGEEKVFLGQRLVAYRADPTKLDNRFLLYSFLSPDLKQQVKSLGSGSTVEHMRVPDAEKLTILLPDLQTQKRIGDVLSAYDDLIENNNRRIKILEESAQKIYIEWFVNFRFPGHEKVKVSNDGIPEGWETHRLDDCLVVHRGKSYTSEELVDEGGLPFINLKCVNRYGGFRKDGIKGFSGKYKDTQRVTMGDIVMAVTDMTQERMIVARCARVPSLENDFGVISMDLVKIEPKDNCEKNFLYSFFRWSEFADEVKNHANGANVLHLNPQRVSDYEFLLPTHSLQKDFSQSVEPMFGEIDSMQLVNENLKKTRDLLIPQLVSGKLEIK